MPSISTKEQLIFLIVLLLPGFIIAMVRNSFVVRRGSSAYEEILAYVLGSAICHVVGAPVWKWILDDKPGFWGQYLALVAVLFALPVAIGIGWSYIVQHGLIWRLSSRLGLAGVHPIRTAWEWKFSRVRPDEWLLVTLKDGTQHAGFIGGGSFFASGDEDRDLFIEQVYELTDEDIWRHPGRRKSILIPYSEVQSIVFWPDDIDERTNVQEANT